MAKHRIAVIGGGLAGLSATHEILRLSKERNVDVRVVLIEKESRLGGNSAKASSGMNAVLQHNTGGDTWTAFFDDTMNSGGGLSDKRAVMILARTSHQAYQFLTEQFHVNLSVVSQLGGHSRARTWRNPQQQGARPVNVGFAIVTKLIDALDPEQVTILTNTRVVGFSGQGSDGDGAIDGLLLESGGEKLLADAVIVTTGGYGADQSRFLSQHLSAERARLPTTNGPFAQGDGLRLAASVGAKLINMDQVQIHPTAFYDPANPTARSLILAPEALRGSGALLLHPADGGNRFVNELDRRDEVANAIFAVTGADKPWVYLVMNNEVCHRFQNESLAFYRAKGLLKTYGGGIGEFASKNPAINEGVFRRMVDEYNAFAAGEQQDTRFGRTVYPVAKYSADEPLHVALVTPAIHYTMGGLDVETDTARVRHVTGMRMYAAGEVTGHVHGRNRLAGNSLLECVVFGRIAGASAVRDLFPPPPPPSDEL